MSTDNEQAAATPTADGALPGLGHAQLDQLTLLAGLLPRPEVGPAPEKDWVPAKYWVVCRLWWENHEREIRQRAKRLR